MTPKKITGVYYKEQSRAISVSCVLSKIIILLLLVLVFFFLFQALIF